ncbi:polysaccharide deacetylase family protein [Ornithinimicrobium sp. Y1847]|uniref:polysaccharide deacetylase family protein n=1 Tax=Ornithinimicrobium sp. Y1847 TaxID=3405419 RepID=UPI003B682302
MSAQTAAELKRLTPSRVVALGGQASVCRSTVRGAGLDTRPTINCAQTACVAVTFDDGPSSLTTQVLDIFATARVPATFFVVGRRVAERSTVARNTWIEGHQIGNHTYDHVRLTELTRAQQREQMTRTDSLLNDLGMPTTTTMRPPFLAFNNDTRNIGKAVIMTDVNPKDWDGPSAQQIRTFIRNNVREGSIVILHDTVQNTVTALPGVLSDFEDAGYTVVTVDELIPDLRPGDLVYNRTTRYRNAVDFDSDDSVELSDGRVLPPLEDTSDDPTPDH